MKFSQDRALRLLCIWMLSLVSAASAALGQVTERVVDVPTRPGVTQRMLVLQAAEPKATVILFAGGHGGLQIFPGGSMKWGEGNFLVRTRQMFQAQGFNVLVLDAPSDRLIPPYLNGHRQRPERVADIQAVIAWARSQFNRPVWLIGTSRGTQSVAFLGTELSESDGLDGIVLTASIVVDTSGRAVPAMPLEKVKVPVLVVHHENDGCSYCPYSAVPQILDKLTQSPRKHLLVMKGGIDRGDPCEANGYHGFNGIEQHTIEQMASWILGKKQ